MKLSDIKNVEYWAEEYRMSLFWLADRNHIAFKDNFLAFYKDNTHQLYYINNRQDEEAKKGYKYFKQKKGFEKYSRLVEQTIEKFDNFTKKYKNVSLKNFQTKNLIVFLKRFLKMLNLWSKVYTKTEAMSLRMFEGTKDKRIIEGLHQIGKARLKLRKVGESVFYSTLNKILKETAKRFNLKMNDLYFYNYDELITLFRKKKISNKILTQRKKGYLFWIMNGRTEILTGKRFKKAWQWVNHYFASPTDNILRGAIASKGKITGRVKIILHRKRNLLKEINEFKKGEILVTEMTRPQLLTICHKAAAIITDEGGITSHAAIISRELNIPCIIGTKIATKVLKDGDLVEVDANKGIVKIIKKDAGRRSN